MRVSMVIERPRRDDARKLRPRRAPSVPPLARFLGVTLYAHDVRERYTQFALKRPQPIESRDVHDDVGPTELNPCQGAPCRRALTKLRAHSVNGLVTRIRSQVAR